MSGDKTENDSLKRFYDKNPVRFDHCDAGTKNIIEEYIPKLSLPKHARILDIGCGDGRILKPLRKLMPDSQLFGIDISEPNVEKLRSEGFEVSLGDVSTEKMPFEDNSFDLCLMFHTIEHLYDTDGALKEIKRVLKNETGIFLILTPNLGFWINRLVLAAGIQPLYTEVSADKVLGRRFGFLGQGGQAVGHIHVFTLPALLDILRLNGFSISRVKGFHDDRLTKLPRVVDHVLSRRASFSTAILVTCKSTRT
jgi:methionine biosynthesis protein MetW